jgi:hypothetical protein
MKSVLLAADNALKSAIEAGNWRSENVDRKFEEVIHVLSRFEKDFPSKNPTSDPNHIGGTGAREAKMSDTFDPESPSAILYTLKNHFHAKVAFPSVSLLINAD